MIVAVRLHSEKSSEWDCNSRSKIAKRLFLMKGNFFDCITNLLMTPFLLSTYDMFWGGHSEHMNLRICKICPSASPDLLNCFWMHMKCFCQVLEHTMPQTTKQSTNFELVQQYRNNLFALVPYYIFPTIVVANMS